jgi:glycosyltransferase involved in cell wall biosynthesis
MPPDARAAAPATDETGRSAPPADAFVLDIVIPVYNEGPNILRVLAALDAAVATPARVLICYDRDDDDTLTTIRTHWRGGRLPIEFVRNQGKGAHGAVMTGLRNGTAPYALMFPADDDFNAGILDAMVAKAREGADIVCASRFIPGGSMVGCPWVKALLVRAQRPACFTSPACRHEIRRAVFGFSLGASSSRSRWNPPRALPTVWNCWSKCSGYAGGWRKFRRVGSSVALDKAAFGCCAGFPLI